MHGGPNGELTDFNRPKDFIWKMTHQQLLKLNLGEGEKVTTLEEVLMLTLDASKMLINIEIKSPADPSHYAAYEMAQLDLCKQVRNLIDMLQINERTIVSSFHPGPTALFVKLRNQRWFERDFAIFQIFNGGGQSAPTEYKTPTGMQGILVRQSHFTQDMIENTRKCGKKLGVWYGKADKTESQDTYDYLFGETGRRVDYFYSNFPVRAMKARD